MNHPISFFCLLIIYNVCCRLADLTDIHAGIAAQWAHSSEVIGAQESRDDAVLIHLPNHGGIHKVHKPVFIYSNT